MRPEQTPYREISEPVLMIEKIKPDELNPQIPEVDGTVIVLQRNAKDNRDPASSEIGAILPEQATLTQQEAYEYFIKIFTELGPEEIDSLDITVIASEATLTTETGIKSQHMRGFETAEQVITGIRQAMDAVGASESQLLNSAARPNEPAIPFRVSELQDLKMMTDSQDFVDFMVQKYGTGQEFWQAYESDTEREVREQMGVEGPAEIAERMDRILGMTTLAANEYHNANTGRRLIVWAVSHYDSMSPFIKSKIAGLEGNELTEGYYPIDYRAGITISIDAKGSAKTELKGQEIKLDLSK